MPDHFDRKIISVDTSFKDLATSDYVAIAVVGVKGRKRYLLNVVNAHLDSTATEEEILRQREIYKPVSAVLIEDKSNGSAVIKHLKKTIPGVIAINPEGGKASRVQAMAPEWQAGDWYVLRNAAWTEPLLTQLLMFPAAKHDDMVDAVSQASVHLQSRDGYENRTGGQQRARPTKRQGVNPLAVETSKSSTETLREAQMKTQQQSGGTRFLRDKELWRVEKFDDDKRAHPRCASLSGCAVVSALRQQESFPVRRCFYVQLVQVGQPERSGDAPVTEQPPLPVPPPREGLMDFL